MVTCGGYHAERETPMYQSRSCAAWASFLQHITDRCRTHYANADGVESTNTAKAEGADLWDIRPWWRVRAPFFTL